MGFPAQSYSITFTAVLSAAGNGVLCGYAVTKSADGRSYVVATTAALAVSSTGTIDGIALQNGNAGEAIQIQRDAKVDKAAFSWATSGAIENAVVDSNGKVQRASVASGVTVGVVDKEGNVAVNLAGAVSSVSTTLNGDVRGPITATVLTVIAALAGGGTRAVTVDNAGNVGAQAILVQPTGSGLWHSTSNALDGTVSIGAANQVAVTNGAGTDTTWATTGGDVTGPITALVVGKLQGSIALSGTPTAGQALVATSGTAATWTTIGGGVSYGNDLDPASTNGNQIVKSLTGSSGVVLVRGTAALQFGSTNPATTGLIRTANNVAIVVSRNAANTNDLTVVQVDSSDQAYLGTTLGGIVAAPLTGFAYVYAGGVARVTANGSTGMVTMSNGCTVSGLGGGGNRIVLADNSGVLSAIAGGTPGNVLTFNGTTWVSNAPSSGGTPGGSNTQLQYNNAGAFGGTAEFTYASSVLSCSASGAVAFGASPAAAGYLRFANAATMVAFRNAANSADVVALVSDASNNLYVGGSALGATEAANIYLQCAGTINLRVNSTSYLAITTSTASFATATIDLGTGVLTQKDLSGHVAATGDYRVKNAWTLVGRNAANSADNTILNWDSSNNITLGSTTANLKVTSSLASTSLSAFAIGTNPASAGALRLPNNTTINWSNAAHSADVQGLTVDSSNQVMLSTTIAGIVCAPSTALVDLYGGGSMRMRIDGGTGIVSVASACNFSIGSTGPSFNSASNTMFLTNGTGATAGPASGVYVAANSGIFTVWNSAANSGGSLVKMRLGFNRWLTGTPAAADRKLGVILEDGSEWFIPLSTS